ncbi:MAG: pyruvate kinase, partial [archaeon]|nr:pyruvate kinase [archaeon]
MSFYSTKIIATLGPSSSSKKTIKRMIDSGVTAVRINTAHGSTKEYSALVSTVKSVSKEIPIIVDLKGPEIRIKTNSEVKIKKGQHITIGFSSKENIYFNKDFYAKVTVGKKVLFEDGKYSSKIVSKTNKRLELKFLTSALLENDKGVNIPGTELGLPFLSQKDLKVIKWAKSKKLLFYALSFCRSSFDLKNLRKKTGSDSVLIAKIESKEGVNNFKEILEEADGIIVARGDLGAEVRPESIPLLQKKMVKQALNAGKFSVVATQMLESMIEKSYPTRAEISDIANSVLDGADCLMLSGETAVGINPVAAVKEMRSACEAVEESVPNMVAMKLGTNVSDSITKTIFQLSKYLKVNRIVAFTKSGYTCQMISRFREPIQIIGLTWSERTSRILQLYFGVAPLLLQKKQLLHSNQIVSLLKKKRLLKKNDSVIITGNKSEQEQHSNLIEVQK